MTEDQFKFHLEEYKVARAEIATTITLLYETFFGAALASGAIAAWLLTNYDKIGQVSALAQRGAWFIQFGVALIAYLGFFTSIRPYADRRLRAETGGRTGGRVPWPRI